MWQYRAQQQGLNRSNQITDVIYIRLFFTNEKTKPS